MVWKRQVSIPVPNAYRAGAAWFPFGRQGAAWLPGPCMANVGLCAPMAARSRYGVRRSISSLSTNVFGHQSKTTVISDL